jgi:hypothetical protein
METLVFDDSEEKETNLLKELESLIDTAEAVLYEVPVLGGDVMRSAIEITKRSGLPVADQETLVKKAEEILEETGKLDLYS